MSMLTDGEWFSVDEFACRDGTPYPGEFELRFRDLVAMCDIIRNKWGGPLTVVSGYRTPKYNAELIASDSSRGVHGVASGSQHVEGRAADLRPSDEPAQTGLLYRTIMALYDNGKLPMLGGIGLYPASQWVHVDTFMLDHLRKWTGT